MQEISHKPPTPSQQTRKPSVAISSIKQTPEKISQAVHIVIFFPPFLKSETYIYKYTISSIKNKVISTKKISLG